MSGRFILRAKVKLLRPLKEYNLLQIKIHNVVLNLLGVVEID